jgi:hypothetical protein
VLALLRFLIAHAVGVGLTDARTRDSGFAAFFCLLNEELLKTIVSFSEDPQQLLVWLAVLQANAANFGLASDAILAEVAQVLKPLERIPALNRALAFMQIASFGSLFIQSSPDAQAFCGEASVPAHPELVRRVIGGILSHWSDGKRMALWESELLDCFQHSLLRSLSVTLTNSSAWFSNDAQVIRAACSAYLELMLPDSRGFSRLSHLTVRCSSALSIFMGRACRSC